MLYEGDPARSSWQRNRMEYVRAAGRATRRWKPGVHRRHVDWEDFRATAVAAQADPVRQTLFSRVAPPDAGPLPGMPAERYWEFEDGNVNFAGAEAGVTDLLRLSVTEFAPAFGNDWFLVPVRLPVGWIHRVSDFVVTDSFGIASSVNPINEPARFAGRCIPRRRCLAAGPVRPCPVPAGQPGRRVEGAVLEETVLARDEMANLAWAIEYTVQGAFRRTARSRPGSEVLAFQQRIDFDGGGQQPATRLPPADAGAGQLDAAAAGARQRRSTSPTRCRSASRAPA